MNQEEVMEAVRKVELKHAVDKVLETQEVLAKARTGAHKEDAEKEWQAKKANIGFNYYMSVLRELLKEKVKEGEPFVVVFQE